MSQSTRPLSPHLQVYRWQVSNTLSILHRITGVGLTLGALCLVGWLLALASGQAAYTGAITLLGTLVGQLALVAWSFCFFYHLCNGIRHLAWDTGRGFDKATARKSGLAAVSGAVVLTVLFWVMVAAGGAS